MIIEKNKNTFEDLLGLEIETEDKFLNKKLNSNVCYLGGGGGGQKQQDIAPTLRPFVTDVLERAKGEFTQEELAPYLGERVVGFSDDELAAQEGILGLVDRGISSDKRLSSADTYYDPALGLLKRSGRYTDKGASEITADEIQGRMNPYTQAVLDIAKRKAADEGTLYRQQLASQAARTGGFGGSRQAILEAKAASDLGGRLSEIQTKGLEAAYNDAIRAAEASRGRQFQAASGLGALSGQYGNLGQQALGQAYREQGYRSGVGEAQRGLEQQRADIGYQTFVEQRDFPARQLERYAGIAFGVPQGYLQQPGPASPSSFQQFAGGAATVGGLGRGLGFFKEGGDIGKVENGLMTVYRKPGGTISPQEKEQQLKELERLKGILLTMNPKQKQRGSSIINKQIAELEKKLGTTTQPSTTPSSSAPSFSSATTPVEKESDDSAKKPFVRSEDELVKLIRDASKIDAEALEKAAKSQEGFALAGLGLELMGKPLAEVDASKALQEIGAARAAREGIPAAVKKAEAEGALSEIELRSALKDLGTTDLIPEFQGIDEFIESYRGLNKNLLNRIEGPKLQQFKREAQEEATLQAAALGIDTNSERAIAMFKDRLKDKIMNIKKPDPSSLSGQIENSNIRADNVDVNAQRFKSNPNPTGTQ